MGEGTQNVSASKSHFLLVALWVWTKIKFLLTKMGSVLYQEQGIIMIFREKLVIWLSSERSKFTTINFEALQLSSMVTLDA